MRALPNMYLGPLDIAPCNTTGDFNQMYLFLSTLPQANGDKVTVCGSGVVEVVTHLCSKIATGIDAWHSHLAC